MLVVRVCSCFHSATALSAEAEYESEVGSVRSSNIAGARACEQNTNTLLVAV